MRTMIRAAWAAGILAAIGTVPARGETASGPDPKIPELAVLEQFAGKWSGQFSGRTGQATNVEGTSEWILGGSFLQTRNVADSPTGKTESMTLWTYDPRKKCYRRWVFLSGGVALEESGQWDAGQQKFTFDVTGIQDVSVTATARVVDPDTRAWTYLIKNKDGQVTGEIHGTNTRRK